MRVYRDWCLSGGGALVNGQRRRMCRIRHATSSTHHEHGNNGCSTASPRWTSARIFWSLTHVELDPHTRSTRVSRARCAVSPPHSRVPLTRFVRRSPGCDCRACNSVRATDVVALANAKVERWREQPAQTPHSGYQLTFGGPPCVLSTRLSTSCSIACGPPTTHRI